MMNQRWLLFDAILIMTFAVACTASTDQSNPPPQAPAPAARTGNIKLDLDKIFPPGKEQGMVIDNCTSCHVITPIVVLRMSKSEWERSARDHRERVPALSDKDYKTLYDYLSANFNPDKPVPELPKELLDAWTSY